MSTTRDNAVTVAKRAQAALGERVVSDSDVAATATGYCTSEGCWDQIDAGHSTYSGKGYYGYGSTQLGTTQLYFKVTMSGATHKSYPFWFSTSRGRKSTVLSGERLYLSASYPGGNSMNPREYFQKSFGASSAGVSTQWPSPGPSTYENTATWITVAHEATWTDPSSSYPGSWFMWAKSIKMKKQSNGSYYVQSDSSLPSDPAGAGCRR